jgi:hypothetical protein
MRQFIRASLWIAVLAAFLTTTATSMAQNTNPRFGRWKLKSEAPAPQSNIMTYAPSGERGMKVTIDAVSASGQASQWGYATNFDGKEEPMTGTRSSETAAVRMISDRIAEIVYRRNGQITQILTNVLTPDGNTLGIVYVRPGADGKPDGVSFATYERIKD